MNMTETKTSLDIAREMTLINPTLLHIGAIHQFQSGFTTKKFSINLIDESFVAQADYCGTVSGAKVDKSGVFEYHLGEAGTPVIEKSPLVMECEVIDTYQIDNFNNYICSISHTYVNDYPKFWINKRNCSLNSGQFLSCSAIC